MRRRDSLLVSRKMSRGQRTEGRLAAEPSFVYSTSPPCTMHILMLNGDPEGVREITKDNWSGRGLVFPRQLFSEVRRREEMGLPGVYVLWGLSEAELPRVYVGEAETLLDRLERHIKGKDFWTHGVTFTSMDKSLNKVRAQYLEAQLVQRARVVKRCMLDNSNIPKHPKLSATDIAFVNLYLADMLPCFPIVGLRAFEESEIHMLFLKGEGTKARGYESLDGFVVCSGSTGRGKETPAFEKHPYFTLRRELLSEGILKEQEDGNSLLLAQDYAFNSPSAAGAVLLGRTCGGLTEWKDKRGRLLKDIRGDV